MKDSKAAGYIYGITLCPLISAAIFILFPDDHMFGYLFAAIGAFLAVSWVADAVKKRKAASELAKTKSEFDELFVNLGLGFNGSYPKKIGSPVKAGDCTEHTFTLPAGLHTDGIKQNIAAIEQFTGNRAAVEYKPKRMFVIRDYEDQPI